MLHPVLRYLRFLLFKYFVVAPFFSVPLCLCGWFFFLVDNSQAKAEEPIEIRVGLLAYQGFREDLGRYQKLFSDIEQASQGQLTFRLASGTYGDLVHWLNRSLIDIAIVAPGIVAEGLPSTSQAAVGGGYEYVATVAQPGVNSALAAESRRAPGLHTQYQSLCLTTATSGIASLDDLRKFLAAGRARLLMVDPLSVSGNIAPRFALAQAGINFAPTQVEYTHSHTTSVDELLASQPATNKPVDVAFVWDGALEPFADQESRLRVVPFDELAELPIPGDAVVARAGFDQVALLRELLQKVRPDEFQVLPAGASDYRSIQQWRSRIGLPLHTATSQHVTLDELGSVLLQYGRSQPRPARLALVLSGGGAKCSYQVGAVAALEGQLATLRSENPGESGLDIGLVVGTSGGAINAVPMALGVTRSEAGQKDFGQVWQELDQREVVRPSALVRANIGMWFALLQLAIIWWIVKWRIPDDPQRRARVRAAILIALGTLEIVVGNLPLNPWSMLGQSHVLHHAWLWGTFGVHWSAWCLVALGLTLLAMEKFTPHYRLWTAMLRPYFRPTIAALLVGLPLVQIVTVLFYEQTLSNGHGIEHALAEKFPRLIDSHLARQKLAPLNLGQPASDAERLEATSREVVVRRLAARDLILTGSCLSQTSGQLPSDLYFFLPGSSGALAPPLGSRVISLAERPSILLDVVMGSGSIYPVFPSRSLRNFPQSGDVVELVDGGFAHNSPIEAAVLWGATHIILVQASPEEMLERRNFVENSTAAFSHLYDQAQQVDARSKEKVVIFTLTPSAPHLCVLDFADNLIAASIAKGYREARGESLPGRPAVPTFRKELGEPIFWTAR